jgi:uncharacterized RDD family membrane protein YckC
MMAPSLQRRLACMIYEAILLFGIVFISGWLFDTLTQSRHALTLRHSRQIWLLIVLGAYFTYFWCTSGQTLAMKTWRICLVRSDGTKVLFKNALLRYLFAWLLFLPGIAAAYTTESKGWAGITIIMLGIAVWLSGIFLDSQRQFLHDRLASTRLITAQGSNKARNFTANQ